MTDPSLLCLLLWTFVFPHPLQQPILLMLKALKTRMLLSAWKQEASPPGFLPQISLAVPPKLFLLRQPMLHAFVSLFEPRRLGCRGRIWPVPRAGAGWQGAGMLPQDGRLGWWGRLQREGARAIICHIVLSLVFKNNNSSTDS